MNGGNQNKKGSAPPQRRGKNKRPQGNKPAAQMSASNQKRVVVATPGKKKAIAVIKTTERDRLLRRTTQLSRESLAFFTAATDPMHDSSFKLSGWPDRNIELSVKRKIQQTAVLGFPSGNANFATTQTYDIHIVLNPWLQNMDMREESRTGSTVIYSNSASQSMIGGLQAYATQPGANFVYGSNLLATGTAPKIGELLLDPKYTIGVGRVIAIGIELINTTAELYKNGHVYCWRAPEPNVVPTAWSYVVPGNANAVFSATSQVFRYPPSNTAQAQLYTGTEDWEASKGAYMVGTFTDFENPALMVSYTQPILLAVNAMEDVTYIPGDNTTVNETPAWVPAPVQTPTQGAYYSGPGVKLYPYNQMGMIITGLTKESTFSLKMNVYYESFPSLAEPDILTIAAPSTRYDPKVLELLSRVMRCLPVAVESKENAEGDWWDRVLQALEIAAPGALTLFGGEILAPGVMGMLKGIREYRNQ